MRELFMWLLYLFGCSCLGVFILVLWYAIALTIDEIKKHFKKEE